MDVLILIDRLEDMVRNGSAARLGAQVRLDRHEAFELLGDIRRLIPEEIRHARFLTGAREEILREAKVEAERILAEARQQRSRLVGPGEVGKAAEQRAERILEGGRSRARQIRLGANGYADEIFGGLQSGLAKLAAAGRAQR